MRPGAIAVLVVGILSFSPVTHASGQEVLTGISIDSAMANLLVIAGRIGPRPMGSPAEHRAMEFALERLKAFGCQDTFILPMLVADGVNTTSGVAVGVLKGESRRIIVIGGHIDSAGPDVPGADDDGSGSACVLEIARVLAQQRHHSTILFCLWGGEEQGLRGSSYFVGHYPEIDSVALMFQLDMVDGKGPLDIDPDGPYQVSSPRWLVTAAYEEFFDVLHHTGLRYPTQFATINASGSGSTGSDHIPFIVHGIPAVDFTSDVEYPIHTPLDKLSTFTPSGFQRAGDVIVRLVNRFDAGQPETKTDTYLLFQIGTFPLFMDHWFISFFAILSILAAVGLSISLFMKEGKNSPPERVRGSGIKLFLAALIVNVFIWMTPSAMGLMTGFRFPWAAQFGLYVMFSLLVGVLGSWFALGLLLRLRISTRVAPMFVRAMIGLLIAAGFSAAYNLEIAVYPAAILALITLAIWLKRPWIGAVLLLLAAVVGYRFIFSEATGLVQRTLTATSSDVLPQNFWYHIAFIGLFTLITLPLLYAGVALVRSVGRDFLRLRTFSTPGGLAVTLCAVVICGIYVGLQRPYDPLWEPSVLVRQSWNALDTSGSIRIVSSEPFRNAQMQWAGRDTAIARATQIELAGPRLDPSAWVHITSHDSLESEHDSSLVLARQLVVTSAVRPYQVVVTFESKKPFELSSWRWSTSNTAGGGRERGTTDRRKVLRWYSFPETPIVIPVEVQIQRNQKVSQTVEFTFDTLATPVAFDSSGRYCIRRMVITQTDSLRVPDATGGYAEVGIR